MKFHIITLFPESFDAYFKTSIMGKALQNGLFELCVYKLNDFSENPSKRVDDKAYGMHGQVISAPPLSKAIDFIFSTLGKKIPVLYPSPSGELLNQEKVETYFASFQECIIICGHYEGIDQRIIEMYEVLQVSIGEYVISSGELATSVLIDALVRHIPGVLGNAKSLEEESFSTYFGRQKEHPVYTRPESFLGRNVPEVLLSGHHAQIEKWKQEHTR